MSHHTVIRSQTAIGLALALSALTCWVTLSDVSSVADLTPAHALTLAAVPLAIFAGHSALPLIFGGRVLVGLGMLALTVGATAYLSAVSGIRNTAAVEAKGKRIAEANAARVRAGNDVTAARTTHTDAKAEETAECKRVGPQCDRKTGRTAAAWSHVLLTEATRQQLGAIEDPMAGYRALAELASLAPGITAERGAIERGLVLALPWLAVVLCELGAVVCFSAGFNDRHTLSRILNKPTTTPQQEAAFRTVSDQGPKGPETVSGPMSAGALTLRRLLMDSGQPMTVSEAASDVTSIGNLSTPLQTFGQPATTQQQKTAFQTLAAQGVKGPETVSAPLSAGALALRRLLMDSEQPMTVSQAAQAMAVGPSEASKRWREIPDIVAVRVGRKLMISLG